MSKYRVLTPEENQYVQVLAQRILYITKQADALKKLPLESIHEPTGLPVFIVLCMLMEAAGYTDQELNEALS